MELFKMTDKVSRLTDETENWSFGKMLRFTALLMLTRIKSLLKGAFLPNDRFSVSVFGGIKLLCYPRVCKINEMFCSTNIRLELLGYRSVCLFIYK